MLKRLRHDLPLHLILLSILVTTYLPFAFVVENSFKDVQQFASDVFALPAPWHLDNYAAAWDGISGYLFNTIVVGVVSVAVTLILAALGAYAFARFRFPGREALFLLFLGLLMIPTILTLIPLFLEIKALNLFNTWWALILPYVAGGQALTVFVLRSFFAGLPEEMFEAARIDGASEWQSFTRIAVPLSGPILGAMAIINALGVWGDYLWPTLVLQDRTQYTISAGIANYTSSFGLVQQTGDVFAGYVLATLPVIVLIVLTMRLYISGVTSGALKL